MTPLILSAQLPSFAQRSITLYDSVTVSVLVSAAAGRGAAACWPIMAKRCTFADCGGGSLDLLAAPPPLTGTAKGNAGTSGKFAIAELAPAPRNGLPSGTLPSGLPRAGVAGAGASAVSMALLGLPALPGAVPGAAAAAVDAARGWCSR